MYVCEGMFQHSWVSQSKQSWDFWRMLMSTSTNSLHELYFQYRMPASTYLGSLFMRSSADVSVIDCNDLVTPPQSLTRVRGGSSQDERDEDSLSVLPTDNIEAQAPSLLVKNNFSGFPEDKVLIHQPNNQSRKYLFWTLESVGCQHLCCLQARTHTAKAT